MWDANAYGQARKAEVGIILLVTKMPQRERLALLVAASLRVL
jgi:hypothetical protein